MGNSQATTLWPAMSKLWDMMKNGELSVFPGEAKEGENRIYVFDPPYSVNYVNIHVFRTVDELLAIPWLREVETMFEDGCEWTMCGDVLNATCKKTNKSTAIGYIEFPKLLMASSGMIYDSFSI